MGRAAGAPSDASQAGTALWLRLGLDGLLGQVRHEQRLVDPALEDRDAHLHALLDDLPTLEARLPRELRGREVDCHRAASSLVRFVTFDSKVASSERTPSTGRSTST